MKLFILLFFISLQLYSQNNLFRHDPDLYGDFGYSDEEILVLKTQE